MTRTSTSVHTMDDEEPPEPSFPFKQLFVLALCRICEPIAFMSIFPYAYYMVQSYNVTADAHLIAVYVGMVTSAFAFAEFSSGIMWGRISDRIGRKPVLLLGLAGTALSMISFGFARSLPIALLARALGGFLNGNMGVLQTTVAELVKVKEHQPRAFSIMPFVWCLGSVIGPAMGGALAKPCEAYPTLFPRGSIFDTFPFLLPNIICTIVLMIGLIIGILFLEETNEAKRDRFDPGLLAGNWILQCLGLQANTASEDEGFSDKSTDLELPEAALLIQEEDPPEYSHDAAPPLYRSTNPTPRQSSSRSQSPDSRPSSTSTSYTPDRFGASYAFSRQVVLTIATFGILAFHSIAFDQLMPVFLSEPVRSNNTASFPLRPNGGFGYASKKVGFLLAVQAIYSMGAQLFFFPMAARRFGTLYTLRGVLLLWPLLYLTVPYTVLLPKNLHEPAIFILLLTKITFQVLAFPSTAILLTNAVPSKSLLGLVNGAAASTASLARTFGPIVAGAIHSWGLGLGSGGPAWWACGLVCLIGAIESLWITGVDRDVLQEGLNEENSTEALLDPSALEAAISAVEDDNNRCAELYKSDSKSTDNESFVR